MPFSLRSTFSAYFRQSWLPPAVFVAALLLWSFSVHVGLLLFPAPWNTPSATKFISLPFEVVLLRTNEPGQLSLRAFEATTGFPLSKSTLAKRSTREHSGGMQRFDGMEFVIGEGDERHPYPARFELWFRPVSGNPEIKLAERIYRIVGVSF